MNFFGIYTTQFKFYILPSTGNNVESTYYAQAQWPKYDFKKKPPRPANYQIVRKSKLRTYDKINSKKFLWRTEYKIIPLITIFCSLSIDKFC